MRILVTGTEGYIGCLLAPRLMAGGHDVYGLDTGYYRDGWLYSNQENMPLAPRTLCKDLRGVTSRDLEGFDAIVHLAELSNDPLGENSPDVTYDINHRGSILLAKAAKAAGVPRFVYTSSCSVYGLATEDIVSETSEVNPQTAYARCKVLVETDLANLADENFCPVILRNATAYGPSPRMRFDIVLNNLVGLACTTGEIAMISDGTPWRPLVHVLDICTAIDCALKAPPEKVYREIFNVGCDEENHRILEVAEFVREACPDCRITFGDSSGDNRSYRVNFEKIRKGLPGFAAVHTARQGARELRELFDRIGLDRSQFEFRAFTRLKQLEYLIKTKQLDDQFYWTEYVTGEGVG
jgi:nucleoside-diphosphate-sugar epimerase